MIKGSPLPPPWEYPSRSGLLKARGGLTLFTELPRRSVLGNPDSIERAEDFRPRLSSSRRRGGDATQYAGR
jgi:hypothetical protein